MIEQIKEVIEKEINPVLELHAGGCELLDVEDGIVAAIWWYGEAGLVYLVPSMAATLWFCWKAWLLFKDHANTRAMPVFYYSCFYLFAIFGSLTFDRLWAIVA